ncbi:MAG: O-methyltransferase [Acidimicrobiales bacterium]
MTEERWIAVDAYIEDRLAAAAGADAALEAALAVSTAAGLPPIHVPPNQGRLLEVLVRCRAARTVLEIGTLGGYSTIWMARALPAVGRLVTLELDPGNAEIARRNIAAAGLAGVVDIRIGPALSSLADLATAGDGPFDMVFIDADKEHNADYLDWSLRLTGPGSLIVVDNVIRGGEVADAASTDPAVVGTRRLFDRLGNEPRLRATAIQTVGVKGHDGFAVAVVV